MSICDSSRHESILATIIPKPGEHIIEELRSPSAVVTTDELLRCGDIISHNIKALYLGLRHMVELICGVVRDTLEAGIVCPILKNVIEILAKTTKHAAAAIKTVDMALMLFYRCIKNRGHWNKLPAYLSDLQEHNRRLHELWPQNRNFLNQELLPALSGHFYSSQSNLPFAALWVANLTRSEQFFPRLQAWGQLPDCIAGICATLDPLPPLVDKVETYIVELGERVQVLLASSPRLRDAETKKIEPALDYVCDIWAEFFRTSNMDLACIEALDPFARLPVSLMFG